MRVVNLGGSELIIILVIVLVLFGGAKLPKLARSLGQAQKEFKDGIDDAGSDATEDSSDS
ncbi:MAG: twin-arginine translocase TatA/TatE family subunit [Chloroflexi bacterium]|nr:twin-arginine translocase TatA/TatE family subunit [Chloroflexota bacterium]